MAIDPRRRRLLAGMPAAAREAGVAIAAHWQLGVAFDNHASMERA